MRNIRLSSFAKAKIARLVFTGLHERLENSYSECPCCEVSLEKSDGDSSISSTFKKAAASVYDKRDFSALDLNDPEVKALTKKYYTHFKKAIDPQITQEVPVEMRQKLMTDVFVFSGFKTYTALKEASSLLLDESGNIKSPHQFKQDVLKINATYNTNYLEAERLFAISSSQSAAKWAAFSKTGDRYDLQYRTASDDRVRASHALLHNTTLPIEHPFWDSYFPPNGWRCRCNAIQVIKGKYQVTDTDTAMAAGDKATTETGKDGTNKLAMFRFNPGKQQVIFPEHHPYAKIAAVAKPILQKQAEQETGTGFKIKKEIKSDSDLNEVFSDFAKENPDCFARGFNALKPEKKQNCNGSTDMNGNIWLKKTRIELIKDGLNAIRKGEPTSLLQEDALSTMWHEINHNRNKPGNMRLSKSQTVNMELANEFVSRNTLPDFMKALGGKLQNENLTLDRKTTGYNTMVLNYQKLIEWSKSDKNAVLNTVQNHLFEKPYDQQMDGLAEGITSNSPYKYELKTIKILIAYARDNSEEYFSQILARNSSLLVEKSR